MTITGEDAGLMKELTTPAEATEVSPQPNNESTSLVIDSTKPMYPKLE